MLKPPAPPLRRQETGLIIIKMQLYSVPSICKIITNSRLIKFNCVAPYETARKGIVENCKK